MSTNAAARTDCAGEQTRQHPEHVAERWQQLELVAKAEQGDGSQEGARGLGGFLSRLRDGLRVPWVGGVANRRILGPQQAFGVPWLASPSLQRQLAAAAGSSSRATHAAAGRHGALVTGPLRSSSSSAQLGGREWQHACVAGSGVLRHEGCEQRAPVPPAASSCTQSVPPRRALGTVAQRPGRAWQHACVRGGSTATAALGSGALAHPALNSPGADDCSSESRFSNTADDVTELGRSNVPPATRAAGCGSGDAGSSVELQSGPPTAAAAPAADSDAVLQEMRARFGPHWRPFRLHIAWNADNGASESTRVVRAHWRKVHQFTAGPIERVGASGAPCVRLRVHADSFMLHQIRHMVGAAVAVARGVLPARFIADSLVTSTSCTVPLAPPHTLVLEHSYFRPFPIANNNAQGEYLKTTGDLLRMRKGGLSAQRAFKHSALAHATGELFRHADWESWNAQLEHAQVDWAGYDAWRREHSAWEARVAARKAAKVAGGDGRRAGGAPDGPQAAPCHAAWAALDTL